jgi:aflatoxin B1 aldehyde reductase
MIREVAKKHNLTEVQCAMRWLSHHSMLDEDRGDAIIICGVTPEQLKEDLAALEEGPLPEEVVQVLNAAYLRVRGLVGPYNH